MVNLEDEHSDVLDVKELHPLALPLAQPAHELVHPDLVLADRVPRLPYVSVVAVQTRLQQRLTVQELLDVHGLLQHRVVDQVRLLLQYALYVIYNLQRQLGSRQHTVFSATSGGGEGAPPRCRP